MKKLYKTVFYTLLLLCLAACAPQPPAVEVSISETELPSAVGLEVSDTLEVTLSANPSTGAMWEVAFYDRDLLDSSGEPELVSSTTLLGAQQQQVFHFKALKPGETVIKFVYKQASDPTVVLKEFSPSVTITNRRVRFWGISLDVQSD